MSWKRPAPRCRSSNTRCHQSARASGNRRPRWFLGPGRVTRASRRPSAPPPAGHHEHNPTMSCAIRRPPSTSLPQLCSRKVPDGRHNWHKDGAMAPMGDEFAGLCRARRRRPCVDTSQHPLALSINDGQLSLVRLMLPPSLRSVATDLLCRILGAPSSRRLAGDRADAHQPRYRSVVVWPGWR